jgi:hypothetical protein
VRLKSLPRLLKRKRQNEHKADEQQRDGCVKERLSER